VVEDAAAGLHEPRDLLRVHVDLRRAHVLDHADAGHGVERLVLQLAVVRNADVHAVADPPLGGALARERGLRLRERDSHDAHAVVGRRVDREAAPTAAHVEQALTRLQRQLRAHELELCLLRLLECLRAAREERTAVGERLAQEEPEEVVRHVVVVPDRPSVAFGAVAAAARAQLRAGHGGRAPDAGRARSGEREPALRATVERRGLPRVQQLEHLVQVVHGERSGHVGAPQPELPGGAQGVPEGLGRAHVEGRPAAVRRGHLGAVPELDGKGPRGDRAGELLAEWLRGREHLDGEGTVRPMQSI
jgi:hypothetical protein